MHRKGAIFFLFKTHKIIKIYYSCIPNNSAANESVTKETTAHCETMIMLVEFQVILRYIYLHIYLSMRGIFVDS